MENGWIKTYRMMDDHEIMTDSTAFTLFMHILFNVNKETGIYKSGRFLISSKLRLKSDTVYKALKRLDKKYNLVTLTSNNKYTEISVLNWDKYQHNDALVTQRSNNKVTSKSQQSNTKQELRIKNINIYITTTWEFYLEKSQTKEILTKGRSNNIRLRLKTFTVEQLKLAITNCFESKFYTGNNDRGWKANSDYVFRSDEVVDRLLNLKEEVKDERSKYMTPKEMDEKGLSW